MLRVFELTEVNRPGQNIFFSDELLLLFVSPETNYMPYKERAVMPLHIAWRLCSLSFLTRLYILSKPIQ